MAAFLFSATNPHASFLSILPLGKVAGSRSPGQGRQVLCVLSNSLRYLPTHLDVGIANLAPARYRIVRGPTIH